MVTSAIEKEVGWLFHNGQMIIPLRNIITHLDHPQPSMPLKIGNKTVNNFAHSIIHLKESKVGIWDYTGYVIKKTNSYRRYIGNQKNIIII